ncbi:hypothetical protein GCM10011408_32720 [Dyella caseinilytica]|nr:hypothetical protein GCM10011408_32720 [Dyella caseinilytica]
MFGPVDSQHRGREPIGDKLRRPAGPAHNKRLQGGVEFPTGGRDRKVRARERFGRMRVPRKSPLLIRLKVSRSGPKPEPTVRLFPVRRSGS